MDSKRMRAGERDIKGIISGLKVQRGTSRRCPAITQFVAVGK